MLLVHAQQHAVLSAKSSESDALLLFFSLSSLNLNVPVLFILKSAAANLSAGHNRACSAF
jgi:hypothetical protein